MSKWIDIDDISLLKTVSVGGLSAKALWKRIRQQPSIDLVRCKDCMFSKVYRNDSSGVEGRFCEAFRLVRMVTDDDYCSYGERKDNE